jgi:predicted MPP superfamily phosphohydrolase
MLGRVRKAAVGIVSLGLLVQIPAIVLLSRLLSRGAFAAVLTLGLLLNAAFLYRRLRWFRRSWLAPWSPLVDAPFFAWWFGCVFYALFYLPAWGLAAAAQKPVGGWLPYLAAACFGLAAVEVFTGHRRMRIRRLSVPIRDLPPAFDGFRIVQVSDIHFGDQSPPALADAWVARVRELDADLVALTGDYITSGTTYHAATAETLGRLEGRHGVVAVMGNHDYFGDGDALAARMSEAGIRVLRNQGFLLHRGEGALYLAGVDDTWSRRDDLGRALAAWPRELPAVLLAHDPDLFDEAARAGVALVLAGHTHGGQVALPLVQRWANLAWLMSRYVAGRYRRGSATLYVNRGLGTTALPMRVAVPPELAEITLRRA